jgi:hypothetical protein
LESEAGMALLAEEIVEEWLNRQGYFTIRGIKIGVHEIDLLAIKISDDHVDCRHIEVTASIHPVSYITDVPKAIQKKLGVNLKVQRNVLRQNCELVYRNGWLRNSTSNRKTNCGPSSILGIGLLSWSFMKLGIQKN